MDKIKEIKIVKPVEGENTHIKAHEEINNAISYFHRHLNNLVEAIDNVSSMIEDKDDRLNNHIKIIADIQKEQKILHETLGTIESEIKNLKEKVSRGGRYYTQNYEGILDTDSEVVIDLDSIELDGKNYLVNIVPNEVIPNQGTMTYSFGSTSIAAQKYTPHVYLMAKEGQHAVLEYDFTVILTEI